MPIITPGQPGAIDHIDSTQAQFRDQIADVTTSVLRLGGGEVDSSKTTTLYVDVETGSDRFVAGIADPSVSPPLTNQQITCGYSELAPFKTLKRALLEAARLSVNKGEPDVFDRVLVKVAAGQQTIDNAPGTGLTVSKWADDYEPSDEDLRAFNGDELGVIIPRGVSVVGADLRKCVILPTTVPAADADPRTGRGSVFLNTGGSSFFSFTFKDSPGESYSHHLLSCFAFCSDTQLEAYYTKVATAFGIDPTDIDVVNPGETQITTVYPPDPTPAVDSTFGASAYVFNCSLRSSYGMCGMYLDGNKVTGLKSMLAAQFTIISLQRDMNAWQIYTGGAWRVPNSYDEFISTNSNDVRARIAGNFDVVTGCYETDYRNFGYKLINNALIQEVSCFVIGAAVHHFTASGSECTITNSNSNFGQTSLLSSGFKGIGTQGGAFKQDQNYSALRVRRPLLIPTDGTNIRQIAVGTVDNYAADTGVITLENPFDPEQVFGKYGYSLKGGDYIWIENRFRDQGPDAPNASTDVRAPLAVGPYDPANPDQIVVNTGAKNNFGTFTDPAKLKGSRVYIRRLVDTRKPEEREYSLLIGTTSESSRRPVGNYVLRLGGRSDVTGQLDPTNNANEMFLTSTVTDTDDSLGSKAYQVTIRPADAGSSFNPSTYYRVGTPVDRNGRIFRSKRNQQFSTFSGEQWEPSLPMLPDVRGIEYLRVSSGPTILIDADLSSNPDSTDLGIDQSSYGPILQQVRSATDFLGVALLMRAIGYTAQDIGLDESGSLTGTVLEAQPADSRDWNPAAGSSPTPAGKLTARDAWPFEFNRPSLIRAFGQAWEWVGLPQYSKGMPKYQTSPLSDQHKIDVLAVNLLGGRCYNTGFTEDGLLVQGSTITDLGTDVNANAEIAGLGALAGDPDFPVTPTSFTDLSVTGVFESGTLATFNDVLINGEVSGNISWAAGVLPVASETEQGIVQLATEAEVAGISTGSANDLNAITPKGLSSVRGEADGLCELDDTGKVPIGRIPALPPDELPDASTSQRGIVELATGAETRAFTDAERAVTPKSLGSTRGASDGFASLENGKIPIAQLPKLTSADLNLTPQPWVADADNFAATSNFTFKQRTNDPEIQLGDPGDMSNYLGTSGFIVVERGNSSTKAFTGINDPKWCSAVNTWVNPISRDEGLTGTVLIGYYIATSGKVIYTASMVNY